MTINVSSLSGGGASKKISSAALGGTIVTGTTADVTISCPANKFINLTLLNAVGGNQGGVSLSVGGRVIFSSKSVLQTSVGSSTTGFKVGISGATAEGRTSDSVTGGRSEDFVFSFGAATTRDINYSYEVLEDD